MTENLMEITKDNYEKEVKESQLPVVLDFWSPQCPPCMGLMPTVEELAKTYAGKVKFCKANTLEDRRLAIQFRIMTLPTLQFYNNGTVVAQLQGFLDREEIEEKIKILIAK